MKIKVDPSFISKVYHEWESEETQEVIEAVIAELKMDCREYLRHHYCSSSEAEEVQNHFENLIAQVQNKEFWDQMDHLLHFGFEY